MASRYELWSKSKLSRLRTPEFQRRLINETVRNIYAHIGVKVTQGQDLHFGSIDVAEIRGPFGMTYFIIDGQHRVAALKRFIDENKIDIPVHVIVYPCNNIEEAKELFETRNKNVMQTDYVLSGDLKKELLGEIQESLSNISAIFSNTRTTRPYIHLPTFMDKLKESEWFRNIYTMDDFNDKIVKENERLCLLLENEQYVKRNNISKNMKETWDSHGIYLGVDRNFMWLTL